MAKLAFSKLALKLQEEVKTLECGEQIIEIKQYLPLDKKLEMIGDIVNKCWDPEANFYNPCQYEVLINFEMIKAYTNIAFTEKQKEDFSKTYDLLDSNNLITEILDIIPADDYYFIKRGVVDTIKAIYEYDHSAYGILDNIKNNYNNLDLDASEIQQKLADPENMDLLKSVLAKLG